MSLTSEWSNITHEILMHNLCTNMCKGEMTKIPLQSDTIETSLKSKVK